MVALTGGIACGKSVVARMLAARGAAVCDADDLAHDVIRAGRAQHRAIVRRFGRGVVGRDGEIDRQRLGRIVFAEERERRALERIVHPAVVRELRAWSARARRQGVEAVAVVPLLYEAGLADRWDAVICVTAPTKTVLARLAKRGWSGNEARARIAAQMPVEQKANRADYVVRNGGTLRSTRNQVKQIWLQIREKKGSHHGRR